MRRALLCLIATLVITGTISCTKTVTETIVGPTITDTVFVDSVVYSGDNCLYYWITWTGDVKDTAVIYEEDWYLCINTPNPKQCVHVRCEGEFQTVSKVYPLHKMIFSTTPYWQE